MISILWISSYTFLLSKLPFYIVFSLLGTRLSLYHLHQRKKNQNRCFFLASKSSKLGVWFNACSFMYYQMEPCFSKGGSSNTIHLERIGVAIVFTVVAIALIDASISVGEFGMWNSIIFLEAWGVLK